jgi:hypothetical protein
MVLTGVPLGTKKPYLNLIKKEIFFSKFPLQDFRPTYIWPIGILPTLYLINTGFVLVFILQEFVE